MHRSFFFTKNIDTDRISSFILKSEITDRFTTNLHIKNSYSINKNIDTTLS